MKIKNLITIIFLPLMMLISFNNAKAQCNEEDFMDDCAELLDTYTFIKSYVHVDNKGGAKIENSYVFSKDHSYVIAVCDKGTSKLIINLYDRNHKIVSSSKVNGKYFAKIGYNCSATGVYYIESTLDNNAKGCGLSILGFKK